jgi:hypothetical protein
MNSLWQSLLYLHSSILVNIFLDTDRAAYVVEYFQRMVAHSNWDWEVGNCFSFRCEDSEKCKIKLNEPGPLQINFEKNVKNYFEEDTTEVLDYNYIIWIMEKSFASRMLDMNSHAVLLYGKVIFAPIFTSSHAVLWSFC